MRNVTAIARRELHAYFDAPVAYIVLVSFLLVAGWMYFSSLFLLDRADMRMFFTPSPFSPSMLLVILAPAVTMRLVAEEYKTGTIELLMTMPVRDGEVIAGKFLASFILLAVALALTLAYPITVGRLGALDWGPVLSGYLGLLLFAGSLLAIGLACSTLTDNQIVAFIIAFLVSATLYYVYWLQFFVPPFLAPLMDYLSVSSHLANMARGVVDSRDVLFYLSLIAGGLLLAVRALAGRHA
jgi:gliding motility-associated transport system permease protein